MNRADDLLEAVIAQPDDDGPRLVMADWYEEHDEPERAEFIRVQIELANRDEYDPQFAALTNRENELIREFGPQWKIPDLKCRQEFRRGFVEYIWLRGDRLLVDSERIDAARTVCRLRVSGVDQRMSDLTKLPWIHRIRELDLSNNSLVRFLLPDFLEDINTANLQTLVMRNVRMWTEELETLLHHPGFPALTRLDVSGNPLGDEGLALMSQSPSLATLRELIFRSNGLDESESVHTSGMEALARSPVLNQLHTLDLIGHNPGANGLIALVNSPIMKPVRVLSLAARGYKNDDPHWCRSLVDSRMIGPLRSLALAGEFLNEEDSLLLTRWHRLAEGTILDVRKMRLDEVDRERFQASPYVKQIFLPE